MKTLKRTVSMLILSLALFAFPVFADCGDMTNGSKCLVQGTPTGTSVPKTDTKPSFDLDKEIGWFVRVFFGKIFG